MNKPMTVDETYRFWKEMFDHLEKTAGCFVVTDEMEDVEGSDADHRLRKKWREKEVRN